MNTQDKISYLELPSRDLAATRAFYSEVFGWTFEDFGAEYTAFSNAGIDGGFYLSEQNADSANGSVLVILYSADLETTLSRIEAAGGHLAKPIFSFPGGRRFHFWDPTGNELAVWSDTHN